MTTSAYSGPAFDLANGTARAKIGSVAAVLRALSVDGVALTETVADDALPPSGCGIVLAPWPNRVRDARWLLDGEPQQLDITEPALGNASHGLLRNTAYRVIESSVDAVTLGALVAPQHGWPFALDTWVRYELQPDGLTVTHGVTNASGRRAPWAVGAHPYLRVGEVPIEQLTVTLSGATRLELDDRSLPIGRVAVEGTDFDLREGRVLADVDLNVAYGDLGIGDRGDGERADVASLTAPDGSCTTVWHDAAFAWCQGYTPRAFPRAADSHGGPGLAVALEPMTAPPDALNSGEGLIWLEPDATWQASWGIRYTVAS
ncbi:aldose 1-epimerase family protein [soil metagenome]